MSACTYYASLPQKLQAMKARLPDFLEPAEREAICKRIDLAAAQARIISQELSRHEDRH